MSVENEDGTLVNFVVGPATYFVKHVLVALGQNIAFVATANFTQP